MNKYAIKHYFAYGTSKASHSERVIRTIKMRVKKFQTLFGTFRYIDDLHDIVDSYNNTKHSKTKMAPNMIKKRHEKLLLRSVYYLDNNPDSSKDKFKFKKDDFVRISRLKHIFEKGDLIKFHYFLFILFKCFFLRSYYKF